VSGTPGRGHPPHPVAAQTRRRGGSLLLVPLVTHLPRPLYRRHHSSGSSTSTSSRGGCQEEEGQEGEEGLAPT
jgi:hypothetical protein